MPAEGGISAISDRENSAILKGSGFRVTAASQTERIHVASFWVTLDHSEKQAQFTHGHANGDAIAQATAAALRL
ncbi:hypothetical protein [Sinorhizobium chiapasense]|uniref:Uncharacterized protein n=1 Tax=Sinorhizobium chiapasense TaxID=501572 RepID=A0ABZ2BIH9_9HYPH